MSILNTDLLEYLTFKFDLNFNSNYMHQVQIQLKFGQKLSGPNWGLLHLIEKAYFTTTFQFISYPSPA